MVCENRKFAQYIHNLTAEFLIEYFISPLQREQKIVSNCVCSNFFAPPPIKQYRKARFRFDYNMHE